jgi:hypothetical protein
MPLQQDLRVGNLYVDNPYIEIKSDRGQSRVFFADALPDRLNVGTTNANGGGQLTANAQTITPGANAGNYPIDANGANRTGLILAATAGTNYDGQLVRIANVSANTVAFDSDPAVSNVNNPGTIPAAGSVVLQYDESMDRWNAVGGHMNLAVVGGLRNVAAAATLANTDSGMTICFSTAAGYAINLPVAAPGLKFTFIQSVDGANNVTITRNGADTSALLEIQSNATVANAAAASNIQFAGGNGVIGDRLVLESYLANSWTAVGTHNAANIAWSLV